MSQRVFSSEEFIGRLIADGILPHGGIRSCQIHALLGEPVRVTYTFYEQPPGKPSIIHRGDALLAATQPPNHPQP
jgi:hypothetical protein